jgi:hypothetical protein
MPIFDAMFDNAVWWMLQFRYLPYRIMGNTDYEKFVKQFTLNGIKGVAETTSIKQLAEHK